jgi:hypothetical protein
MIRPRTLALATIAVPLALALGGCDLGQRYFGQNPIAVTGAPATFDSRPFSRIVVVPKITARVDDPNGLNSAVESAFVASLLNGGFTVVERSDLDRVLKEIGFQSSSGLTESAQMVKVGKMLNADGLMIVEVNRAEDRTTTSYSQGSASTFVSTFVGVSAKFVAIQQGTQVWVASYAGERYNKGVADAINEAAQAVAAAFPGKVPKAVPTSAPGGAAQP